MDKNRRYVRNIASHPVLPAEHRMPKFGHTPKFGQTEQVGRAQQFDQTPRFDRIAQVHQISQFRQAPQVTQKGTTMNDSLTAARVASGSSSTSRLRLTRRGRIVFTTLAATPLVLAALSFALNGGMATATVSAGSVDSSASSVTIFSGQSLWQVAEQLAPHDDTREVVAQLLHANGLKNAEIFPGQQLLIPDQYR